MMPRGRARPAARRATRSCSARSAARRARPRFAVGPADPDPPRLRPVRQPAPVPADAGRRARRSPAAPRPRSISTSCARTPRASTRGSAAASTRAPTRVRHPAERSSRGAGVDRILEIRLRTRRTRPQQAAHLGHEVERHHHTMPFWDERFAAMAKQYPDVGTDQFHMDILCAHFVQHPNWFDVVVGSNLFGDILTDLGRRRRPGRSASRPSANINPERDVPFDVRAGARLGARHRRARHRQPDRRHLVGGDDARAPRRDRGGRRGHRRHRGDPRRAARAPATWAAPPGPASSPTSCSKCSEPPLAAGQPAISSTLCGLPGSRLVSGASAVYLGYRPTSA